MTATNPVFANHKAPARGETFHRRWAVGALLLVVDLALLEGMLFLAVELRQLLGVWFPAEFHPGLFLGPAMGVALMPLGLVLAGHYPGYGLSGPERIRQRTYASLITFCGLMAWDYMVKKHAWSGGALMLTMLLAPAVLTVADMAMRSILTRTRFWGMPVLLVGAGHTGALVARVLSKEAELGLDAIGFLDDEPEKWGSKIEGLPVLGPIERGPRYVGKVGAAIVCLPNTSPERLQDITRCLPYRRIIIIPNLLGVQSLWIRARDLGGMLGLELRQNLLMRRNWFMKRTLDYALTVPAMLVALPIIAVAALLVKLNSPGPAFYMQRREGRNGRWINVYKLRTMHVDGDRILEEHLKNNPAAAEEWERFFKLRNDPRIIPLVGDTFRRYSIDELPQLWNVLRGDMSLVGPRPFPDYHLSTFDPRFRKLRMQVLPGVTGLWQVLARSDGDIEVQETLDSYYIRNWSIWLDLYILFKTPFKVVSAKGAA